MRFAERKSRAVTCLDVLTGGSRGGLSVAEAIRELGSESIFEALTGPQRRFAALQLYGWAVQGEVDLAAAGPPEKVAEAQVAALEALGEGPAFPYLPQEKAAECLREALSFVRGERLVVPSQPGSTWNEAALAAALLPLRWLASVPSGGPSSAAVLEVLMRSAKREGGAASAGVGDANAALRAANAVFALGPALEARGVPAPIQAEGARLLIDCARHRVSGAGGGPEHPLSARAAAHAVRYLGSAPFLELSPDEHLEAAALLVDYARLDESAMPGDPAHPESVRGSLNAVEALVEDDPLEELEMYRDEDLVEEYVREWASKGRPAGPPKSRGDAEAETERTLTLFDERLPDLRWKAGVCLLEYAVREVSAAPGKPGDPRSLRAQALAISRVGASGFSYPADGVSSHRLGTLLLEILEGALPTARGSVDVTRYAEVVAEATIALCGEHVLPTLQPTEMARAAAALASLATGRVGAFAADPGDPSAARARAWAIDALSRKELAGAVPPEAFASLAGLITQVAARQTLLVPDDPEHVENKDAASAAAHALATIRELGRLPQAPEAPAAPAPATRPEDAHAFAKLERLAEGAGEGALGRKDLQVALEFFLRCADPATPVETGKPGSPLSLIAYRLALGALASKGTAEKLNHKARAAAARLSLRWARHDFLQTLDRGYDEDYGRAVVYALTLLSEPSILAALENDTTRAEAVTVFSSYVSGERKATPEGFRSEWNAPAAMRALLACSKEHVQTWVSPDRQAHLAALFVPFLDGSSSSYGKGPAAYSAVVASLAALEAFASKRLFDGLAQPAKEQVAGALALYILGDRLIDPSEPGGEFNGQGVALAAQSLALTGALAWAPADLRVRALAALGSLSTGQEVAVKGNPTNPFSVAARKASKVALKRAKAR